MARQTGQRPPKRLREFVTSIGIVGASAIAGCVNTTPKYGLDDKVSVREGNISLTEIRLSQFLFTQPSDSPTNILGRRDTQFIVFNFDTSDLDVEREFDYITDNIQFQTTRDTIVPEVQTPPRIESEQDDIMGVAFEVSEPFTVSDNMKLRWLGDEKADWPGSRIFTEEHSVYLNNPPQLTVESVDIPDSTSEDTANITLSVSNDGNSTGEFKAIVRGDDTKLVNEFIEKGVTLDISTEISISQNEQPVVISWSYDQRSGTINRT